MDGNKYVDEEGNERTLEWIIGNKPEWAYGIIQNYRSRIETKNAIIKAWEAQCGDMVSKTFLDYIEDLESGS